MTNLIKLIVFVAAASVMGLAQASPDWDVIIGDGAPENVTIQDIIVNGDGCPNAEYLLAKDRMSVSILFSDFWIESPKTRSRRPIRKNCQISLNMKVPSGYSVAVYQIEYRGYLYLPDGAKAEVSSEYFYAGIPGNPFVTKWDSSTRRGPGTITQDGVLVGTYNKGELDGAGWENEYLVYTRRIAATSNFSPCKQDVQLRNQTTLKVYPAGIKDRNDLVFASVDSADTKVDTPYGYRFLLAYKKCK